MNKRQVSYVSPEGTPTGGRRPGEVPRRQALDIFWEYIEHELEQVLGEHAGSERRRSYGACEGIDHEGDSWVGDYPDDDIDAPGA